MTFITAIVPAPVFLLKPEKRTMMMKISPIKAKTERKASEPRITVNPLYAGGFFHRYMYMLDESICHFRDVRSVLSLLFYFRWKIL